MGEELIWQSASPVCMQLDSEDKKNQFTRFRERIISEYESAGILAFLMDLTSDDFFNNLTSKNYYITIDKNHEVKIPKGYKVLKAFKLIEDNESIITEIQQEASAIIQMNCCTGYLCFSVHPLDFLSLSENTSNWRSCHALDGEFRSGNLSYMLDSATLICYIKSSYDVKLPRFPEQVKWNNKKWRTLLFFSNDRNMLIAGRQYPYTISGAMNMIKDFYLPAAGFHKYGIWHDTLMTTLRENDDFSFYFPRLIPVGNSLIPLGTLFRTGAGLRLHFDDVLNSSFYSPIYAYFNDNWSQTGDTDSLNTRFYVGKDVPCPICGEHNIYFPEEMSCEECDRKNYEPCECCGDPVYIDDAYYDADGNILCEDCYTNELHRCPHCNDLFLHLDFETGLCNTCSKDPSIIAIDPITHIRSYVERRYGERN